MSLFDFMAHAVPEKPQESALVLPDIPEWPELECLANEKIYLGFYISGHPLDPYRDDLPRMAGEHTGNVSGMMDGSQIGLAGIIRSKKETITKKGDRMAFLTLEDLHGSIDVVCFPEIYAKAREFIDDDSPVWVSGILKKDDDKKINKINANFIEPLDKACKQRVRGLLVELQGDRTGPPVLKPLQELFNKHHGPYPVKLAITLKERGRVILSLPEEYNVSISPEFTGSMNDLLGYAGLKVEYEPGNNNSKFESRD